MYFVIIIFSILLISISAYTCHINNIKLNNEIETFKNIKQDLILSQINEEQINNLEDLLNKSEFIDKILVNYKNAIEDNNREIRKMEDRLNDKIYNLGRNDKILKNKFSEMSLKQHKLMDNQVNIKKQQDSNLNKLKLLHEGQSNIRNDILSINLHDIDSDTKIRNLENISRSHANVIANHHDLYKTNKERQHKIDYGFELSLSDINSKLKDQYNRINVMEMNHNDLRKEFNEVDEEFNKYKLEQTDISDKLNSLKISHDNFKIEYNKLKLFNQDIHEEMKHIDNSLHLSSKNNKSAINNLQNIINNIINKDLTNINESIKNNNDMINKMEINIEELIKYRKSSDKSIKESIKSINSIRNTLSQMDSFVKTLEKNYYDINSSFKKSVMTEETEFNAVNAIIKGLENKQNKLTEDLGKLQKNFTIVDTDVKSLNTKVPTMEKSIPDVKADVTKLFQNFKSLDNKSSSLETNLNNLNTNYTKYKSENDSTITNVKGSFINDRFNSLFNSKIETTNKLINDNTLSVANNVSILQNQMNNDINLINSKMKKNSLSVHDTMNALLSKQGDLENHLIGFSNSYVSSIDDIRMNLRNNVNSLENDISELRAFDSQLDTAFNNLRSDFLSLE